MDTVPPEPSPLMCKALLSPRPKGHESHLYPRSDLRGERGESQPLSPPPYSRRLLGGGERGQVTAHGQRDHGKGTPVLSLPLRTTCGPLDRTKTLLLARPLTHCPLGYGRPLLTCSHRNATRNLCSGRAWNRHHSTKVHSSPTGSTYSPMTSHCSSMPTLTHTGNKAAPMISHDHRNPSHALRTPRDRETLCTGRPNMPTRPGQCTQGRARHTPAPGASPWA